MDQPGKTLFLNYSDSGGGAEQFTTDLFLHTPDSEMLVSHKSKDFGAKILAGNKESHLTGQVDKVVRKVSRYRGIHHFLGLHDSHHNTFRMLKNSPEYQTANLIHLNNIHGGWFDLDAIAAIDREKPIVWTLHDQWSMTGGEAYVFDHKGFESGNWNTPYLDHYPLRKPFFDRRKKYLNQKKALYAQLNRTVFVPVSDWLAKCLKNSWVHHPHMKIRIIKNGVDLSIFQSNKNPINRKKKRILFFNNPSPFKGASIGLSVLKALNDRAEIVVVGKRPEEIVPFEYLGEHIDDRKHLAELYNSVDMLIYPSVAENMPLTVLEAMACGVVVIANNVGGIPEIVIDGKTGFLSPKADTQNLLQKTLEALDTELQPLSIQAVEFIRERHSFDDMLSQYRELYAEMLDVG